MKKELLAFLIVFLGNIVTADAQQMPPAMVWNKCFGGSKAEEATSIIPAIDGGFIVAGHSYSSDGDVTGHHGSTDKADGWIFKVSASGDLEWQRSLGGTEQDIFKRIIATTDGNYVAVGTTYSNDGDVTGNHGKGDVWVVKLDRHGNLIWQKTVGGSSDENGNSITNTNDGGYAIVGRSGSSNGDLSGNKGDYDILFLTLSASGDLQSLFNYGGTNSDEGCDVVALPDNNFLIGAQIWSNNGDFPEAYPGSPFALVINVNPSGQVLTYKVTSNRISKASGIIPKKDGKILILENHAFCYPSGGDGVTISERTFPDIKNGRTVSFNYCLTYMEDIMGYRTEGSGSIVTLPDDHMIVVGSTDQPGVAVDSKNDDLDVDAFIARTNYNWPVSGTWKKAYGGSGYDMFTGIAAESEYSWVAAGYTWSNDRDVSGNHGLGDCWLVKFGNFNIIKGSVFADYNLNNSKDANEPFLNDILVQSEKTGQLSASPTQNGIFFNTVDTGTYSTKVLTTIPYYSVAAPVSSSFTSYNQKDSLSFALQPIAGKRDYELEVVPLTPARPGFPVSYQLFYRNLGTDTLENRTIKMVKDPRMQFDQSNPAQTSVVLDTVTWTIPSLLPRESGYITVDLTASAPPALNNDDTLITYVSIDTTGDLNTLNNTRHLQQITTGSYDPNDKQESGAGALHPSAISKGDYLTYTIRFQNTGTDTAFNIVVKDTLSTNTDPASFEMIGVSHPYTLAVKNGNIFTWTFKNILLVDSIRNEPLSHGFITYRVKPKISLVLKDSIHNSASIYFDFNLPVLTNTQTTVVRIPPPVKPGIAGIQAEYCAKLGAQKVKIPNLPETGGGTTATAFLNNQAVTIAADSTIGFNPSTLPTGKNTLKVVFENPFGTETVQQDFQVTAAAEPEVNIQSSVTHIVSMSTPVTITATNAAGGGANPVYSFSKDRGFATVLQQGASPVLNRNATDFTVGDNWIYVRMKTSETCFKTEFNEDSIKINRDVTTGISDPDNPGQVIQVYPNPFKGQFRVNGLNSAKTYMIVITNAQGKRVYSKQASRSNYALVTFSLNPKGLYLLSIYDEKKQQLIGTIPLVSE